MRFFVVSLIIPLGIILFQLFIGGLSKTTKKALFVCVFYALGTAIGEALPNRYLSIYSLGSLGIGSLFASIAWQVLLIMVGHVARIVYDFNFVQQRRLDNDPKYLAEELVELEWRLTPNSGKLCVMAVDVAGSTAMKRGADPLIAEWSFREYQSWVEKTCANFGGKVQSTAGDGAILGFEDTSQAIEASKALLSSLGEFNQSRNRLGEPFKLRIGLHVGEVQGDLGEVQFTRVIDVAAHIEHVAPVNGIAASETVVNDCGMNGFEPAAIKSDGHDVFVYKI